jgi:predicted Zn-dependent protease
VIDKAKSMEIIGRVLEASKSNITEAILESSRLTLTRFAESKIHQNIDSEETTLYIRIARDKRVSAVATGDISEGGIRKAVSDGEKALAFMPPDENFDSFPSPGDLGEVALKEDFLIKGTSDFSAQKRAEAVSLISRIGRKGNLEASGAFRLEEKSLAVGNSLGVSRYYVGNAAQLSATLSGAGANSGWAIEYNPDASQIDVDGLAKRAAMKAAMSRDPISLPDGQYTVILEPAAAGQFLILLAFMGFGAKTFYQRRSFMAGKIGQKIAGENFTVTEDPLNPAFNTEPFDYEGISKRKTPLIERGVAMGTVSNSYYARLLGQKSTGHALPPNNNYGPYPKNMVVDTGDKSVEELIASTEKGILITRFWYLNFLNPMKTMVTGTTRDGTFLIEKGLVGAAIKNMRTNQSILEAFSNIESMSNESVVYPQYSVLMKIPAMKINNFNLIAEEDEGKC